MILKLGFIMYQCSVVQAILLRIAFVIMFKIANNLLVKYLEKWSKLWNSHGKVMEFYSRKNVGTLIHRQLLGFLCIFIWTLDFFFFN